MSIEVKYRVHEVAKDLGRSSKEIAEILTKYATPPKNHMQVLTDAELSIIFEYLTQKNQIGSLEEIFDETAKPETSAPQKAEPAKEDKPAQNGQKEEPVRAVERPTAEKPAVERPTAEKPAGEKPAQSASKTQQAKPVSRVPQKKVVDTRKSADINLGRYDQRLEELAPQKARSMEQDRDRNRGAAGRKARQQRQQSPRRRQEELARQQKKANTPRRPIKVAPVKVQIPDEIAVGELALRMKKSGAEVVKQLLMMGVMASLSQTVDFETASLVAMELGCEVEKEVVVTIEERLIDDTEDRAEELVPRSPVVVVMGHVDHGKTSLLDYVRSTHVASGEAGGITQHIGAYQVKVGDNLVTFLDTPGHEAFTAMRARGAMVTDIAILVVAADDGIMPQTIEAINHAKAAEIPIIVAINKIDKPGANPDRIMQQLTEYSLVPEEWGGDTIVCPISAKTGEGIDNLLEMLILTAEMRELKANPNRAAKGTVIEARLDKGRGSVATLLVQNGTLKQGDVIIAGTAVGHVRAMTDDSGRRLKAAGPSVPVEITGMSEVPEAGDPFYAVADERLARELAEQRRQEKKDSLSRPVQKVSLEDLFDQISQGDMKTLNVIVKADVQGSAEAVRSSLEKIKSDEVQLRVIHCGVGAVNESDIMLASTSNAIVVGFNVRPDNMARVAAERDKVDVRLYRVIYDCIGEIESAMKGMLSPKYKEVELGRVEVRQVYKITGAGIIAGCYVLEGKVARNAQVRLVRDGVVVYEGAIASLRRFKDDVREVAAGYECGIGLEKFSDIKEGDIIEAFVMEEVSSE